RRNSPITATRAGEATARPPTPSQRSSVWGWTWTASCGCWRRRAWTRSAPPGPNWSIQRKRAWRPWMGNDRFRNPLRESTDRRLPRIAGPSCLVIFGVTCDLETRKLQPEIYELTDRTFLLTG